MDVVFTAVTHLVALAWYLLLSLVPSCGTILGRVMIHLTLAASTESGTMKGWVRVPGPQVACACLHNQHIKVQGGVACRTCEALVGHGCFLDWVVHRLRHPAPLPFNPAAVLETCLRTYIHVRYTCFWTLCLFPCMLPPFGCRPTWGDAQAPCKDMPGAG